MNKKLGKYTHFEVSWPPTVSTSLWTSVIQIFETQLNPKHRIGIKAVKHFNTEVGYLKYATVLADDT